MAVERSTDQCEGSLKPNPPTARTSSTTMIRNARISFPPVQKPEHESGCWPRHSTRRGSTEKFPNALARQVATDLGLSSQSERWTLSSKPFDALRGRGAPREHVEAAVGVRQEWVE